MTVYLLETYLARSHASELVNLGTRLRNAARGQPVRYLRTTYVPEDETCFHYVEAPNASAAERLAEQAQLSVDRVVKAKNVTVGTANDSKEGP